jgi:prepilin-type N-terminal cleavage/methylation domain-containing protein
MNRRRIGGFTLIELLVVIAIIALLMSILMPALQRVKKQARSVVCINKLKSWGLFFSMYAEEYDGRFMKGFRASPANRWVSALGDYYKWDEDFTCCPNATKPWYDENGIDSGAEGTEIGANMAWGYTSQGHWPKPMKGSYGMSMYATDPDPGQEAHDHPPDWFWRGPAVNGAGYVPVFLEAIRYNGAPLSTDAPPTTNGDFWNDDRQMGRFCMDRHNGFVGTLFLDFSVQKVGIKQLWTLKWHRQYNIAGPYTMAGGAIASDWPEWMQHYKDY